LTTTTCGSCSSGRQQKLLRQQVFVGVPGLLPEGHEGVALPIFWVLPFGGYKGRGTLKANLTSLDSLFAQALPQGCEHASMKAAWGSSLLAQLDALIAAAGGNLAQHFKAIQEAHISKDGAYLEGHPAPAHTWRGWA